MGTAFEAITTRLSWYAAEKIEKYQAVQFDTDGKFEVADGTRQFAGLVQYGAEEADLMATVVKGTFPAIADGAIAAGDYVTLSTDGSFKKAEQGLADVVVYGIALTDASDEFLFTLSLFETTTTIAHS